MANATLSQKETDILVSMALGFETYGDICDAIQVDVEEISDVIENLEINGYIKRQSYTGEGYFKLTMLDKGFSSIEEKVNKEELALVKNHKVNRLALKILKLIKENDNCTLSYIIQKMHVDATTLTPYIEMLEMNNLISVKGWIYRKLSISNLPEWAVKEMDKIA